MLLRQLPSRLDLGDQIYNKILLKIFKFQVGKPGAPLEYCGGKKKIKCILHSVLCRHTKIHINGCTARKKKKKKICCVDKRAAVRTGEENFASRIAQKRKYMSSSEQMLESLSGD